jgi:hypothetical protein
VLRARALARTWRRPDVAAQLTDLVVRQLADPVGNTTFSLFREVMDALMAEPDLPVPARLVDLGCGPGHYGELLERHHSERFTYVGYDTEAMIEQGRRLWPARDLRVGDVVRGRGADLDEADVILASGLLDVLSVRDARRVLERMLAAPARFIVIHRQEFGEETSVIEAEGYGQPIWRLALSRAELADRARTHGREIVRFFEPPTERVGAVLLR